MSSIELKVMDISGLDELQKQSSRSFHDQKAMIKRIMAGKTVNCKVCKLAVILVPPEQSPRPGLRCAKGCTDIELDFS